MPEPKSATNTLWVVVAIVAAAAAVIITMVILEQRREYNAEYPGCWRLIDMDRGDCEVEAALKRLGG